MRITSSSSLLHRRKATMLLLVCRLSMGRVDSLSVELAPRQCHGSKVHQAGRRSRHPAHSNNYNPYLGQV